MGSYNRIQITKLLYESGQSLFTAQTLRQLLNIRSESSLYPILRDLIANGVIEKLEATKYVLSHFPMVVTSVTVNKSVQKIIREQLFVYTKFTKEYYWGFDKLDSYLIAEPEKALIDQLYLASKGIKSFGIDEYDLERINRGVFNDYLRKFLYIGGNKQLGKFAKKMLKGYLWSHNSN